jgi:hypothetical protein
VENKEVEFTRMFNTKMIFQSKQFVIDQEINQIQIEQIKKMQEKIQSR